MAEGITGSISTIKSGRGSLYQPLPMVRTVYWEPLAPRWHGAKRKFAIVRAKSLEQAVINPV